MKNFTNFFVSLGFLGYIEKGTGTFASIFSILILFPFFYFKIIDLKILVIIFIILILISLYFINIYSKQNHTHDSSKIVIDEFIGIYLIFLFYDKVFIFNNFFTIVIILILFRFFDIIKFFPANIIDKKMINSLGVILDDIVASIYTIITIYLLNVFIQ